MILLFTWVFKLTNQYPNPVGTEIVSAMVCHPDSLFRTEALTPPGAGNVGSNSSQLSHSLVIAFSQKMSSRPRSLTFSNKGQHGGIKIWHFWLKISLQSSPGDHLRPILELPSTASFLPSFHSCQSHSTLPSKFLVHKSPCQSVFPRNLT